MSDMSLAERHARIRAHQDLDAAAAIHQVVTEHFGGDIDRAIWFMQERALIERGGTVQILSSFYSASSKDAHPFYSIKDNR